MSKSKLIKLDIDRKAVGDELFDGNDDELMEYIRAIKADIEQSLGQLKFLTIEDEYYTGGSKTRVGLRVKPWGDKVFGEDISWGAFYAHDYDKIKSAVMKAAYKKR